MGTKMKSSKTFSLNIENIVKDKKITHMEAVLWFCQKEGIEPDTVSSLLSKALKEKIEANARELNFLPRQAQLPV
jgi:Ni,Fe-hydrogenase maturation factor